MYRESPTYPYAYRYPYHYTSIPYTYTSHPHRSGILLRVERDECD